MDKEPRGATPARYLVNRGIGGPLSNTRTDLDLGVPLVATDDDSTSTFAVGAYSTDVAAIDKIDGLTYEFDKPTTAIKENFDIVPATGQILSQRKLDYEIKDTYVVTVKATDPWGLSASKKLTINVIDVDEPPLPITVTVAGESAYTVKGKHQWG